jgi:allantoin racemase
VVGIAEAAMHAASFLGRGFSVVTTLARTTGRAWDLAEAYGMTRFCRAVRACEIPVLALEDPESDAFAAIVAESRRAVADDGAEAIVLGCAGMADLAARMTEAVGVLVVDGWRRRRRPSRAWSPWACARAATGSSPPRCPRPTRGCSPISRSLNRIYVESCLRRAMTA